MAIMSVPVRTNEELRPSRLFGSMFGYVKKSMITIMRAYLMYKPLRFFAAVGSVPLMAGIVTGLRYLFFFFHGTGDGHVQSLLLAVTLILLGAMITIVGLQADVIAANRKMLEDIRYEVKKATYGKES